MFLRSQINVDTKNGPVTWINVGQNILKPPKKKNQENKQISTKIWIKHLHPSFVHRLLNQLTWLWSHSYNTMILMIEKYNILYDKLFHAKTKMSRQHM